VSEGGEEAFPRLSPEDAPAGGTPRHRFLPEGLEWLPAILLAASWIPRIAFWLRRDYNHDDLGFAWGTWQRAMGARVGVDLYGYGFVFLFTEILKPLFRWFPESFFPLDFARCIILVAQIVNIHFVYRISRKLGAEKKWALAACSVAAWQPDLILRAGDVRTDPLGACCLLAAANLLLNEASWHRAERIGLLLGLAIILDYKFGVASPFAALAVVLIAWPAFWRPVLRLTAGATAVVVVYLGWLIHADTWAGFSSGLRQTFTSLQVGAAKQAGVSPGQIFHLSPLTFGFMALGAIGLMCSLPLPGGRKRAAYASIVVFFLCVFVKLNPYFFPYNFNLFAPLLATMIPGIVFLSGLLRMKGRAVALVLLLACVTSAGEGLPALGKALSRTNAAQKRIVRWIWKATAPDEHVFDWLGMALDRPGVYHWWLFSGLRPVYQSGRWYSVADELQRYRVTLLISNYRLAWLNPSDLAYVQSHYVWIDSCLLSPGQVFRSSDVGGGGSVKFVPAVEGEYRFDPRGISGLLVDGRAPGPTFRLSREFHELSREGNSPLPPVFAVVYSTALRERNPDRPCPADQPLFYGFD